MGNGSGRFKFAGHAIGAAAKFHRLDEHQNLNHVVPTQGSSYVPAEGGRVHHRGDRPFRFDVDAPRKRCLLQVDEVYTLAEGRQTEKTIETEVSADVKRLWVVEKLRCELIHMHMLATRTNGGDAVVTTDGNRINGLWLSNIEAKVTLDETPLAYAGTEKQFTAWHRQVGRRLEPDNGGWTSTIVRDIQLVGDGPEREKMSVEGNSIRWKGFGRIILGEIHVKDQARRLTLVRLAMGSDAGGEGTAGEGQSNGSVGG